MRASRSSAFARLARPRFGASQTRLAARARSARSNCVPRYEMRAFSLFALPLRIEAIANREHHLVVAHVAAVGREIRPAGNSAGRVSSRPCRSRICMRVLLVRAEAKFCCPSKNFQAAAVAHLPRKRDRLIVSASE